MSAHAAHVHVVEALVDVIKRLVVRDKLVDPELSLQVVLHDARDLASALDATERRSLPHSASDKLEPAHQHVSAEADRHSRSRGDLRTGGGDTDDVAHSPALVACLERRTHHIDLLVSIPGWTRSGVRHSRYR